MIVDTYRIKHRTKGMQKMVLKRITRNNTRL